MHQLGGGVVSASEEEEQPLAVSSRKERLSTAPLRNSAVVVCHEGAWLNGPHEGRASKDTGD